MSRKIPRRFTQDELEILATLAPHTTQSQAARSLGVRVTAINNWAKRHGIKFLNSRRQVKKPPAPVRLSRKESVQPGWQDVDRLMALAAKAKTGTAGIL